MAQTQVKDYTHLVSQEGNYIYLTSEDKNNQSTINWTPLAPATRATTVDCMVWEDRATPGIYYLHTRDELKKFLSTTGIDYNIWMYGAQRWGSGVAYVIGNITWYEEEAWLCAANNTGSAPSDTNVTNWTKITTANVDSLTGVGAAFINTYIYKAVWANSSGNLTVIKTTDHKFTVTWLGQGTIAAYALRDYKGELIEYKDKQTLTQIDFTLEEDGVYYVEMGMSDNSIQYAEIYDLSDTEQCYLVLMRDVLCDCIDCEDCPGPNYARALNYANTYILLRDIIYARQAVMVGLMSSDVLNNQYLEVMGLLIDKLKILASKCACKE